VPELPDVTVYVECLERLIVGSRLASIRIARPFVLRTVDPSPDDFADVGISSVSRIGKRIVISCDGELHAVIHLMIAGRLRWRVRGTPPPKRGGLAAFHFDAGTLLLTEAGSKRRASLHLVRGRAELAAHDPGGLEVQASDLAGFRTALTRSNHTLKRALTDPRILSGIGNAYSDEILHRARLSPFKQTRRLDEGELGRLHRATLEVLEQWTSRLRDEAGDGLPEKVTAFRSDMAVHGRYGQPCPDCGAPVQRVVYAQNEANYCPGCQTEGRLLADRALSRLLKADWPKTVEELER